jgi:hypothetical protein
VSAPEAPSAPAETAKAPEAPPEPAPAAPAAPATSDADTLTFDDVLTDAGFAREYKARVARELEAEKAKWKADAEEQARRSRMEEVERLKLERDEAAAKIAEVEARAREIETDRDIATSLVSAGVVLRDAEAREFLSYQVRRMLADKSAGDAIEATRAVLAKHDYLARPAAGEAPRPPATTIPASAKSTEAPAVPSPAPAVDTLTMTPQEYKRYRRETHGIH